MVALGVPEVDWETFLRSPGFGGTAAVVAALIAFWAAARSRRAENERARETRWWEQARWAVELIRTTDPGEEDHSVSLGVAALNHLVDEADEVEAARFARIVLDDLMPDEDEPVVDTDPDDVDTEGQDEEDDHG